MREASRDRRSRTWRASSWLPALLLAAACHSAVAKPPRSAAAAPMPEPVLEVAAFGMVRASATVGNARDTLTQTDAAAVAGGDFYLTAETLGLPETMVDDVVGILSGEFDFHRDLAQGFKCTVLFEMQFEDGRILNSGKVLAVRMETPARTLSAYWLDGARGGYYTAEGKPMRSIYLRSPIVFSRVTSNYSVRRFHPILKTWRAHNGVDFSAPAGTPVRATADGVLAFAGVSGGYGKLVALRHPNGTTTMYGHLQSIRGGLKSGQIVRQGETIGAVGSTGLATGPHLHYELRRNDRPVDPGAVGGTPPKLAAAHRTRFKELVSDRDRKLGAVYRTHFVQRQLP